MSQAAAVAWDGQPNKGVALPFGLVRRAPLRRRLWCSWSRWSWSVATSQPWVRRRNQRRQTPRNAAADNQDVSQRYRFLEQYRATDDPTKPELLTQYQVGCRETVKITLEKPQGAPELQRSKGTRDLYGACRKAFQGSRHRGGSQLQKDRFQDDHGHPAVQDPAASRTDGPLPPTGPLSSTAGSELDPRQAASTS